MMEATKREEIIGDIADAISDWGGELIVDCEIHLYIARRLNRD